MNERIIPTREKAPGNIQNWQGQVSQLLVIDLLKPMSPVIADYIISTTLEFSCGFIYGFFLAFKVIIFLKLMILFLNFCLLLIYIALGW